MIILLVYGVYIDEVYEEKTMVSGKGQHVTDRPDNRHPQPKPRPSPPPSQSQRPNSRAATRVNFLKKKSRTASK
jgi:hypothetical protein